MDSRFRQARRLDHCFRRPAHYEEEIRKRSVAGIQADGLLSWGRAVIKELLGANRRTDALVAENYRTRTHGGKGRWLHSHL